MSEASRPIVQVHGGSALLERVRAAGLPGQRLEWCDPVCGGPTPRVEREAWYPLRAAYLAAPGDAPAVEARLRAQDAALAAIPAASEIVIWSGPELFCQSILMRLLVLIGARVDRPAISLVDPGDQPGQPGCGLTAIDDDGLRALFAGRRTIGEAEIDLAQEAWHVFTAPGARPMVAFLAGDTRALPHLGAALDRHLHDLPDGGTGLSTTETSLLQALESGPLDRASLLTAIARREARPWLTDTLLEETLHRLSGGNGALVGFAGNDIALTARARAVLAGYEVWQAERWLGGIHIGLDDEEDGETAEEPTPLPPRDPRFVS